MRWREECGSARRLWGSPGQSSIVIGHMLMSLWCSVSAYFFILHVLNMLLSFNISGERAWFLLLDAELLLAQYSLCIYCPATSVGHVIVKLMLPKCCENGAEVMLKFCQIGSEMMLKYCQNDVEILLKLC
jgi:hypothetical protein